MDSTVLLTLLCILPIFLLLTIHRRKSNEKLPPGSLGIPFIGQSLGLLRAMRANTAEKWLQDRINKYGPISKLTLFGTPTVFLTGPAANKFIFTNEGKILTNQQPESIQRLMGNRNLLELTGEDHKRVRGGLGIFLRPEVLKKYVGKMDEEVRQHFEMHWRGRQEVTVFPLMKTLTFDIICTLLIGVQRGVVRERFVNDFQLMIEGAWSVPLNLPFTRFNRSLRASSRLRRSVNDLIREKRSALENGQASPNDDLITSLLSIRREDNAGSLTDEEIVSNAILIMSAGHDTSSVVLTFLVRLLANNPVVYAGIVQEQEEIAKRKAGGEVLTWEDLGKMKYTWRVAMETLRMVPPVFGSFRKVLTDIDYAGYLIPKGWQIFWASSITHMDGCIYPEPSKFDPARFDGKASVPPFSFVAFGGGARICPGYEFARIEILVAIHYLVTQFTWKLAYTNDTFVRDPMPTPYKGLPIKIMPKFI